MNKNKMNQYIRVPLRLLGNHILFIVLAFVFMFIFGWLIEKKYGLITYSIFISLIYTLVIYGDMWDVGNKDAKPYTKEKPYLLKGLLMGIIASSVSIVLVILFFIAKAGYFNFDNINFIYRVWMTVFIGFIDTFGKKYTWIFWAVIFIVPVFSFLGYLAGMKSFYLRKDMRTAVKRAKENAKDR